MTDKDKIEKLLSLKIEKKIRERSFLVIPFLMMS